MRLLLAFLGLLLIAPTASGQPHRDGSRRAGARRGDDARAGRLAAVGSVPWESLAEFPPAAPGVGVRYWASERTVVGGTLGLSVRSNNGASDVSTVRGALWVERHLGRRRGPVSPFVIVELDAARDDNETIYVLYDCPPETYCPLPYDGEDSVSSLGASVGAGAEVRLLRGITLSSGYRVRLAGERVSYDSFPGAPAFEDLDIVTLDTGAADLRLSIYF